MARRVKQEEQLIANAGYEVSSESRAELDSAQVRHLSSLTPGEAGHIVAVRGEAHLTLRMLELGLVSGTPIRLLRAAPLGGPMQIDVGGFLLSLRRNEAEAVHVAVA